MRSPTRATTSAAGGQAPAPGEFGDVDGYVDLHHMGPCQTVEDDRNRDRYVTVAIDYPPLPPWEFEEDGRWEDYPNMQAESRQLNLAFADAVKDHGEGLGDGVARYYHPDWRDYPGQARSSLALNGTPTVLVEMPGQTQSAGNKDRGKLVTIVDTGVRGILDGLATGAVDEFDDQRFYELPRYW